jgi:hypothetical protein
MARTTSLRVVPEALLTPRSRSIGQSCAANRRAPVIRRLRMVLGVYSAIGAVSLRSPRLSVLSRAAGIRAASALIAIADWAAPRGSSRTRSANAACSRSIRAVASRAAHGGGAEWLSGSVDSVACSSRIAATPSTRAWCSLE